VAHGSGWWHEDAVPRDRDGVVITFIIGDVKTEMCPAHISDLAWGASAICVSYVVSDSGWGGRGHWRRRRSQSRGQCEVVMEAPLSCLPVPQGSRLGFGDLEDLSPPTIEEVGGRGKGDRRQVVVR
jgi:hypothetical protein